MPKGLMLLALSCGMQNAFSAETCKAVEASRFELAMDREHATDRLEGVVLVGLGDQVVHRRAVGLADRERRLPHRLDDCRCGDFVSKEVATVLAMPLVEHGRIELDVPLKKPRPVVPSPQAGLITLEDVLQHTSGLPNPDDTPGRVASHPTVQDGRLLG